MIVFKRGVCLLMTAYALAATVAATAQSPEDPKAVPAYRKAAMHSMLDRIQKKHYQPKAINDSFSVAVFDRYLHTLDPNGYIFLKEDVKLLEKYRLQVDEQLQASDPAFFEAAYAIYRRRTAEAEADYRQLMAGPFRFDKKEQVKHIRKNDPFPASAKDRKELWRKLLKYYVIRNYMELAVAADSNAVNKPIDPAILAKAEAKVKKYYDDFFALSAKQKSGEEKFEAYLNVVAMVFDAHTMYTGPKDRTFTEMLNKRFFGLGIELENRDGEYYVKRLMQGGTAYSSGLVKENDRIVTIADAKGELLNISGMSNTDVVSMIRGEKGTSVKMQVQQAGEQARTVIVKRDEVIDTENKAKSAVIDRNGKRYGYIRFTDFYMDAGGDKQKGVAGDVGRELARLKDEEVEGLIVDLRSNGGGSLDEVVRMCNYFLPKGAISYLRGKETVNQYASNTETPFYTGPLTVLVDESSASASEIFAAAIQDYGRGLVVGTKTTFGKGTAQQNLNIGKMGDAAKGTKTERYGSLRVTMEKFYRANGTSTQLKGVSSDIVLQSRMSLQSIMETDYPSILPCDTINLPPLQRVAPNTDYAAVIGKANARIAANPVFSGVEAATRTMKASLEQPADLDLAGFRKHYQQWYGGVKQIQALRKLPEDKRLEVALTTDRNINPALRNDADRIRINKHWIESIAGDVYIAETISILEDMLANPAKGTAAEQ